MFRTVYPRPSIQQMPTDALRGPRREATIRVNGETYSGRLGMRGDDIVFYADGRALRTAPHLGYYIVRSDRFNNLIPHALEWIAF